MSTGRLIIRAAGATPIETTSERTAARELALLGVPQVLVPFAITAARRGDPIVLASHTGAPVELRGRPGTLDEDATAAQQWAAFIARDNALRTQSHDRFTHLFWLAMALTCLFVAGLLYSERARADDSDWHLAIHGLSSHGAHHQPGIGTRYNERNVGAGLRLQLDPAVDVQVGAYRNSYDRTSAYAVGTWLPAQLGPLRVGAFAGLTNHYPMRDGRVVPVGGLAARLQGDTFSATLRAVPAVAGKTTGVVAIEFGVRL